METYIISYDMAEGGDYDALFEQIKSYGYWAHINKSTFAVKSSKSASEIRDHILGYLSKESRLFVLKSAHVAAWSNVMCSNEWLKKNL